MCLIISSWLTGCMFIARLLPQGMESLRATWPLEHVVPVSVLMSDLITRYGAVHGLSPLYG